NLGQGHRIDTPRLFGLDRRVGSADAPVCLLVQGAARVQLIPDRTFGAERQGAKALVIERCLALARTEVGPGSVKSPGHAKHRLTQRLEKAAIKGEVSIAPAAARQ